MFFEIITNFSVSFRYLANSFRCHSFLLMNGSCCSQSFNIKHGIDPRQNIPGPRVTGQPALSTGANKGRSVDLETMMRDYWQQFGWDPSNGHPRPDILPLPVDSPNDTTQV